MLKFVIAVRHGNYEGGRLTDFGVEQAENLACAIQSILNGARVILFSSPLKRAVRTAEIIGKKLATDFVVCQSLESDYYGDGEEQMGEVSKSVIDEHEAIVTVGHYDAVSGIINAFSEKHLSQKVDPTEVKKGQGLVLDLSSGGVEFLP